MLVTGESSISWNLVSECSAPYRLTPSYNLLKETENKILEAQEIKKMLTEMWLS